MRILKSFKITAFLTFILFFSFGFYTDVSANKVNCSSTQPGQNCGTGNYVVSDGCIPQSTANGWDATCTSVAHGGTGVNCMQNSKTRPTNNPNSCICPTGYAYNDSANSCSDCASGYIDVGGGVCEKLQKIYEDAGEYFTEEGDGPIGGGENLWTEILGDTFYVYEYDYSYHYNNTLLNPRCSCDTTQANRDCPYVSFPWEEGDPDTCYDWNYDYGTYGNAIYQKTLSAPDAQFYNGNTGNIGIGTASPDQKLSVIGAVRSAHNSSEGEYVEIGHGGANAYINWAGDGILDLRYTGPNLVSITQSGNVGIGKTSPGQKLDVSGNARVSSNLYIGSESANIHADSAGLQLAGDSADVSLWVYDNEVYIGDSAYNDSLHIRGNVDSVNNLKMRNNADGLRPRIEEVGGIYFTWDADERVWAHSNYQYTGTTPYHAILSANGAESPSGSITLNSFNHIRLNIDTNNNNSNSKFIVSHNGTGSSTDKLFMVTEEAHVGIGNIAVNDPSYNLSINDNRSITTSGMHVDVNADSAVYVKNTGNNAEAYLAGNNQGWMTTTGVAGTVSGSSGTAGFFQNMSSDRLFCGVLPTIYLCRMTYGIYATGGYYAGYFTGNMRVTGTCDGDDISCNGDIAEHVHSKASSKNYVCDEDSGDGVAGLCKFINNFESEFETGDVACLDPENPTFITHCEESYSNNVLSVINYDATFFIGKNRPYPVSLMGNVPVRVTCDKPIYPGDLLVTADKPGYAMKLDLDDENLTIEKTISTVFAKATQKCESGEAVIRAWLTP